MNAQFYVFRRDFLSRYYDYRRMVMKQPPTVFGKRLKNARQRLGIPQDRLGWTIGLDEHTASARISRYETGVHEPPYSLAQKLAEALGIKVAYFYTDDDELAEFILRWGMLGQIERTQLMSLLNTLAGATTHSPTAIANAPSRSTR